MPLKRGTSSLRAALLAVVLISLSGCGKPTDAPNAIALKFITASDEGRSDDAMSLIIPGGEGVYWNLWNFDPWVPRRDAPAPHWVDHVVIDSTTIDQPTYDGDPQDSVYCRVFPKGGGHAALVTYYMRKHHDTWYVAGVGSHPYSATAS